MRYAVIGTDVQHSLSPAIYRALFARYGIADEYDAVCLERDGLAEFVRGARAGLGGFNVTMPFKREILPMLDMRDESAERYDSCNTVLVRDGILTGYSTDAAGFLRALGEYDVSVRGMKVVLLGAGGAAYAVALGMLSDGAESMIILNRNEQRAVELRGYLHGRTGVLCETGGLSGEALARHCRHADLLVNTTALGMDGKEAFTSLDFLEYFRGTVNDIVYIPRETALLSRARELGLHVVPGLPMLICQALIAFEHYSGIKTDRRDFVSIMEGIS